MKIEVVKFRTEGFMTQPFAFGGEDGTGKFDAHIKYRSCLQNYVIDTGTTGAICSRKAWDRGHRKNLQMKQQ